MVESAGMVNWPLANELNFLLSACGMAICCEYQTFNESVVCVVGLKE